MRLVKKSCRNCDLRAICVFNWMGLFYMALTHERPPDIAESCTNYKAEVEE
jgi:hypothetical protein